MQRVCTLTARTNHSFSRLLTLSMALLLSGTLLTGCGIFGSEDATAPDPPRALSGTSLDGAVELTWDAVEADDLDGYNVYRSESSSEEVSDLSPINSELLSETSFTDNEVNNGTTYFYLVTALDEDDNESGASNEAKVTPFSDPPDRPAE